MLIEESVRLRWSGYGLRIVTGIVTVSADHIAKKVQVCFDDSLTSPSAILACIESKGYSYGNQVDKVSWGSRFKQIAIFLLLLVLLVLVLLILLLLLLIFVFCHA